MFELLDNEAVAVDRFLMHYDGALDHVETEFYSAAQDEQLDLKPSDELADLLGDAPGYLNYSTYDEDLRR